MSLSLKRGLPPALNRLRVSRRNTLKFVSELPVNAMRSALRVTQFRDCFFVDMREECL